jgi:hypothetical protein
MMGLPPAAVLIEEMRRFAFALAWLQETTLARLSSPGTGGLMVSLIHDGFGEALQRWSADRIGNPRAVLHAITAPRGAAFEWGDDQRSLIASGNEDVRIVTNLRWRGAGVMAHLRNVVFVNCDLRGAFFHHSVFDGVTFLNCMMEGVIIIDSKITSAVDAEDEAPIVRARGERGLTFAEPVFEISEASGLDADELAYQTAYRGVAGGTTALLSTGTDIPAVPVVDVDGTVPTAWAPARGGIAIFGSRTSAIVIRRSEGDVRVRYSRGSGFDVLEHDGGDFDFFDVTLRHVRFAAGGKQSPLKITVSDSVVSQLWLGEGLHGEFVFTGGALVQAWSEADPAALSASVSGGTRVYGTVGIDVATDCGALDGLDGQQAVREAVVRDARFFAAARAMDHLPGAAAGVEPVDDRAR